MQLKTNTQRTTTQEDIRREHSRAARRGFRPLAGAQPARIRSGHQRDLRPERIGQDHAVGLCSQRALWLRPGAAAALRAAALGWRSRRIPGLLAKRAAADAGPPRRWRFAGPVAIE